MKSIVISQKAFAHEVFMSFSARQFVNGQLIVPNVDKERFIWQFNHETVGRMTHEISREEMVFRSLEASDMIAFLWKELDLFQEHIGRQPSLIGITPLPQSSGMVAFDEWFKSDIIPRRDNEESYSIDVLIDLDGRKKLYSVGWYDFDAKEWRMQAEGKVNEVNMLWKNIY